MSKLTIITLNDKDEVKEDLTKNIYIEKVCANENNIKETIRKSKSKYITFINKNDTISSKYNDLIIKMINREFDCCFINYDYKIKNKNNNKILKNKNILIRKKPLFKDYIWSFIFKKEKLEKLLDVEDEYEFNNIVKRFFLKLEAIEEPIIFHDPYQNHNLNNFIYSDVKKIKKSKNLFYVEKGCDGVFNGYISLMKHYGRCYGDKYEIAILYDSINLNTKEELKKYFICLENKNDILFICDKLFVLYTSYYYPKNIISLSNNYLIIQGNMSDYKNVIRYSDDIYTNYLAGSQTTAEKAKGFYPTDNIEYVLNPYKLDKKQVIPRIKLVSTFRYTMVKHPERIEKMAKMLDELEIPYTWEVFTDKKENTNKNGLIYRSRTANPLPYVADCDYFVLLSDSEAFCYSVIEALSVQTKVVVTPLPVFNELGILNKYNTTVIPFEYFDKGNESKLKNIIIKMYINKDKKINFKIDKKFQNGYDNIFT